MDEQQQQKEKMLRYLIWFAYFMIILTLVTTIIGVLLVGNWYVFPGLTLLSIPGLIFWIAWSRGYWPHERKGQGNE